MRTELRQDEEETDGPAIHIYGIMGSRMKTTIELPDDLFVAAKKAAAEARRPLREIFEEGLRRRLAGDSGPARRRRIRWVTVKGGLPPGVDVADRAAMHEWLARRR